MPRYAAIPLLTALLVVAVGQALPAAHADWVGFTEPSFGASLVYPRDLFSPVPREGDEIDQRFQSSDGKARLAIGAWRNVKEQTPGMLKSELLQAALYESVTYDPSGRSWFVLSGYNGPNIYYQKVMYSCGGTVIAAFGMTYPTAERARYDPVVERIEDNFRPAQRCR